MTVLQSFIRWWAGVKVSQAADGEQHKRGSDFKVLLLPLLPLLSTDGGWAKRAAAPRPAL